MLHVELEASSVEASRAYFFELHHDDPEWWARLSVEGEFTMSDNCPLDEAAQTFFNTVSWVIAQHAIKAVNG